MRVTSEDKKQLFKEFGGTEANTGSVEAQVAILSKRIDHITGHLKTNKKDHANTRALLVLVGKRRKLLKYIASNDIVGYRSLIEKLGIRR